MLRDFNDTTSPGSEYHADYCVVGTGPAGMTLAIALAESGNSVILAEGGSFDFSEQSQEIYKGENFGLPYDDLANARLRYFGGTSNHWSGMCGIFDAIDFDGRKIFGLPGWPISRDEVLKHLPTARKILDLDDSEFLRVKDPIWSGRLWRQRPVAYSPPTRFGEKYRNNVVEHPQIQLMLNANLSSIELESGLDKTGSMVVTNYQGITARLLANRYIVAMGALENSRILLNCNRQMKLGIGNDYDLVGRYFMEHLNVQLARFFSTNDNFWFPDGKPRGLQLLPEARLMEDEQIGNGVLAFAPSSNPISYGRTKVLKQIFREAACATDLSRDLGRYLINFNCAGEGEVTSLIEQLPNPNSRVTLIESYDQFGLKRLGLNWAITEGDSRTIRRLAINAAKEMAEKNVARLQLMPYILNDNQDMPISGHAHQMGTTRMSISPHYGVVDPNCRVHGMKNLYLAGGSIFPTGGGTNPTLTIVMLALRLAEHLSKID
jgi:choline dehydrogenase-like flavoprotein